MNISVIPINMLLDYVEKQKTITRSTYHNTKYHSFYVSLNYIYVCPLHHTLITLC